METKKVTVIGASGEFGSALCDVLQSRGVQVTRAHRAAGVDAVTGDGLAQACAGADVIVDATGNTATRAKASEEFFGAVARQVSRVAEDTGTPVVYLTIYGASDPTVNKKMGHYRGKAVQESVYTDLLGQQATAFRSTQWYSLPEKFLTMLSFGPIGLAPHMRSKPADVADVAATMADVVLDPNRPVEITVAGPAVMDLADAAKAIAAQNRSPKKVFGINFGGGAIRSGALVPPRPDVTTPTTFEQWLAAR